MEEKRAVLLLSGGLDSGSLLFWALHRGWEILPLLVDYGQTPLPGESRAVSALLELAGLAPIQPISLPEVTTLGRDVPTKSADRDAMSADYFPSRNLLLITLASVYASANDVSRIMIGLVGDAVASLPDCSPQFLQSLQEVLALEYPQLALQAPFIERSKIGVVGEAMEYGFRPELTFCCNRLADHHCWTCASCLDRLRVFRSLDLIR